MLGPLWDYAPAAGLRWLVIARPQAIAESKAYTKHLDEVVETGRLDAFQKASGLDLRRTSSVLIAGYDYGTLYLVSSDGFTSDPVERFEQRLVSGPRRQFPTLGVQRVVGVVGNTPKLAFAEFNPQVIENHLVAYAVEDTSLARVVELFARRKLSKSHPVFQSAALESSGPPTGRADVSIYFPGPFEGEWALAGHGLVASAAAIRGRVELSESGDAVTVALSAVGSWDRAAAEQALELTLTDMQDSPLGTLLSFDKPVSPPRFEATEDRASLTIDLVLSDVVSGLKALVKDRVEEFLPSPNEHPPPNTTPSEGRSEPDPEPKAKPREPGATPPLVP